MKVLLIHQHYNSPISGGPLRSYFLAKALKNAGIELTVLTSSNQAHDFEDNSDGFTVKYLAVAYNNSFGFVKRILSFTRFARKCIRYANNYHRNYNLCYAISTPLSVGWAALQIKKKFNLPYIFEVGDLWPDAPVALGFIQNKWLIKKLYVLEKKIYENALHTIALSPAIAEAIKTKSKNATVSIIPNMADLNFFSDAQQTEVKEHYKGLEGKLVVSYTGALGYANGLDYLIDGIKICHEKMLPVYFFIAGEGAESQKLKTMAKSLNLSNLTFLGLQNRKAYKELMSITDVSFVGYRNSAILETGSPNKFFDALAAGKVLLINFSGWMRELVETNQCGFWVNPLEPQMFAEKISHLVENPSMVETFKMNSKRLAINYSREKLSIEFASIIKSSFNVK